VFVFRLNKNGFSGRLYAMFAYLPHVVHWGLYLAVLSPLFFGKYFMFPFVVPKIYVFQALVEIMFAAWLALAIFDRRYRPRLTPVTCLLGLFLFGLTLSSLLGLDLERSFWSTQARGLGLVALYHFAAFFLMLVSAARTGLLDWRKYLAFGFGVSVVTALGALLQVAAPGIFPVDRAIESAVRPGSFFGNPSFLAAYLLFHVFLGLWLAGDKWRSGAKVWSWLILAGVAFNLWAVFLTQTRGALLGLAAGFLVLLVYLAARPETAEPFGPARDQVRRYSRILLGAGAAFVLVFALTRGADIWHKIPGLRRVADLTLESPDIQPRILTLGISREAFLERPFLGFGFENFKYAFDKRYDPRLLRYGFVETYFDKPHNVLVEMAVVGGLLGLGLYFTLLAVLAWRLARSKGPEGFLPFGLAALAGYTVQNLFLFDTFGSYLMFFLLLAVADAHDPKKGTFPAPASPPIAPEMWKAAVAAIFLAGALYSAYAVNWNVLQANNRQYWGVNWALNRRPDLAVESFIRALTTPPLALAQPYKDEVRRDFAQTVTQIYEQGVEIDQPFILAARVLQDVNTAIENRPNEYFLRTVFADIAAVFYVFNEKYLDAAEAHLAEALKSSPRRQQIYYSLARVKLVRGLPGEAMDLMRQAVVLDPESGDPHFYYGLTALQAGQRELGFAEIELAEDLGRVPKNGGEARILANYLGDDGQYDRAIELYLLALQANPEDLESRIKLGLVYYYSNRLLEARRELGAVARAVDLTQSPYYSELKEIYDQLGIAL
jgi:O-antigen ligase